MRPIRNKPQGYSDSDRAVQYIAAKTMDPDPRSGCTVYKGKLNEKGYPRFHNKSFMATLFGTNNVCRAVWKMSGRKILSGQQILHKCDNTSCINLAHLAVGSCQDNANDRTAPISKVPTPALINRERKATKKANECNAELARRHAINQMALPSHFLR